MTKQRTNGDQRGKMHTGICPVCKKRFEKSRPWHKYDTLECGLVERNRRRTERVKTALARMMEAANG